MSTPGGLVDKQELIDAQLDTAHLGRVVNSKDASGAPINTSTNRTGGVNKTLNALEAEYQGEIDSLEARSDAAIVDAEAEFATQRDQFNDTFQAQFQYGYVGNISDYAGQSLPETDKLNAYQYPDDSDRWYGPIQNQSFPITIPSDPSAPGSGWVLVNALTSDSLSAYTDIVYKASGGNSAVENMIAGVPISAKVGDSCKCEGGTEYKRSSIATGSITDFTLAGKVNPTDWGVTKDSQDCKDKWVDLLSSNPAHIHFSEVGNYTYLSGYEYSNDIVITGVTGVAIDCTSPSFSDTKWLTISGSVTQISNLNSNASVGDRSITLFDASSVTDGDIIIIFNPTNGSWSTFRDSYKAGEFIEVSGVIGNTISCSSPLYDSYLSSEVEVYKLNPVRTVIGGGMEIKGDLGSSMVNMNFNKDSFVNNLKSNHKNNSILSFNKSFNCSAGELSLFNSGDGGDDYGVAVVNSQSITLDGGKVHSRRHAVTTGSDGAVCAVPCRDIKVLNMTLSNEQSSNVHCADFHGNTEDSYYKNCTIYGGATWQGKNVGYINCIITNTSLGACIISAEIKGGKYYARDCSFKTYINPQISGRYILDVGGNTNSIDSRTSEDCTFEICGGDLYARGMSNLTTVAGFNNRGFTGKINMSCYDIAIDSNEINTVLRTTLSSGTANSDFIECYNIKGITFPTGKQLVTNVGNDYLNFPHKLQAQSGSEVLSITSGTNTSAGTPVVFKWGYPRTPTISISRTDRGYAGNRLGIAYATPTSGSGLTPLISTSDATNFSANTTMTVNWSVEINEV
ncbi:hypothetical protein SIPHO075v1_p0097 [Vibrio phage PS65A.1]|nr:hypothetical protein SIPHO075v1_p0097 [Vibrio phage PS65A.1]